MPIDLTACLPTTARRRSGIAQNSPTCHLSLTLSCHDAHRSMRSWESARPRFGGARLGLPGSHGPVSIVTSRDSLRDGKRLISNRQPKKDRDACHVQDFCLPRRWNGSMSVEIGPFCQCGQGGKDAAARHVRLFPLPARGVSSPKGPVQHPQTWPQTVDLGDSGGNQMKWSHHRRET